MKINNLNDFISPMKTFENMPDLSGYNSPITMIVGEMETKMEADTMSVIQRYGIDVNKDELIKALNYDRQQYEKGYQDACNNRNLWNRHQVACLLANMFQDTCACNYNDNDTWLPQVCDFANTCCPDPVGVACWEQFLKNYKNQSKE